MREETFCLTLEAALCNQSCKDTRKTRRSSISRKDEFIAQERDKTLSKRWMSPPEPKNKNSNALKFAEREDCADWAEHLAEAARVKAGKLHKETHNKKELVQMHSTLSIFIGKWDSGET